MPSQLCSVRSSAFARAAVGRFQWIAQRSNLTDLVWIFCTPAQITANSSFALCFVQKTKAPLAFLFSPEFSHLACAVPHTCGTWSPVPLPRRLCRWPGRWRASPRPLAVAPIVCLQRSWCRRVCAVHLLHLHRNVSFSAPSRTTAWRKFVVNFGFTTFLDSTFLSRSPTLTAS